MDKLFQEIEALSLDEFKVLLQFIDKTRKQRAKSIMAEAQKQVSHLISEGEINTTKKVNTATKPPKFRDPDNADNTWSGYGRQPDWMKTYIENGGNKDDLRIP